MSQFEMFLEAIMEKMALLQVGDRFYTNVAVIGFNATDLYFRHDGGFSNIRLKYLSDEELLQLVDSHWARIRSAQWWTRGCACTELRGSA